MAKANSLSLDLIFEKSDILDLKNITEIATDMKPKGNIY